MVNIQNEKDLQGAISSLELSLVEQRKLLEEQMALLKERLQPINLVRETFKEIISSPMVQSGIKDIIIGSAAGFLVTKLLEINASNSSNSTNWIGSTVQMMGASFATEKLQKMFRSL
jgi:hypothetical protein